MSIRALIYVAQIRALCVGTKYVVGVPYSTCYPYGGGVVVDSNGPDWVAMLDPMPAGKWKAGGQKGMLEARGKGKVERNQGIGEPHKGRE